MLLKFFYCQGTVYYTFLMEYVITCNPYITSNEAYLLSCHC